MKLKINNKYENIGIWSFLKCNFITSLMLTLIIYTAIFLIGFMIAIKNLL